MDCDPTPIISHFIASSPPGRLADVAYWLRSIVRDDSYFYDVAQPLCLAFHRARSTIMRLPCEHPALWEHLENRQPTEALPPLSDKKKGWVPIVLTNDTHLVSWVSAFCGDSATEPSHCDDDDLVWGDNNTNNNNGAADTSRIADELTHILRAVPSVYVADRTDGGEPAAAAAAGGEDALSSLLQEVSYGFGRVEHVFLDTRWHVLVEVDVVECCCIRVMPLSVVLTHLFPPSSTSANAGIGASSSSNSSSPVWRALAALLCPDAAQLSATDVHAENLCRAISQDVATYTHAHWYGREGLNCSDAAGRVMMPTGKGSASAALSPPLTRPSRDASFSVVWSSASPSAIIAGSGNGDAHTTGPHISVTLANQIEAEGWVCAASSVYRIDFIAQDNNNVLVSGTSHVWIFSEEEVGNADEELLLPGDVEASSVAHHRWEHPLLDATAPIATSSTAIMDIVGRHEEAVRQRLQQSLMVAATGRGGSSLRMALPRSRQPFNAFSSDSLHS